MVEQVAPPEMGITDKTIVVQDFAEVLAFMKQNPQLEGLIITARSLLPNYFPDATYRLELISDPEVDHQELLLTVMTALEVDEALEQLRQFSYDWWLAQLVEAKMKLSIDVGSASEL